MSYLAARLREPSTSVAIGVLLGIAHVSVDPGTLQTLTGAGAVLAAAGGALLAERGN